MRFQKASLMHKLRNPCPICGAETALAEIVPHPLQPKFEIHGYCCNRCGPIKSVVVLAPLRLQTMM
jgi:ribosomal protein S27AE